MKHENKQTLPTGCTLLRGITVGDDRGNLTFVEGSTLPFPIKRMFWITSVPSGKNRGGHAHASCSEAVFAVQGAFTMHLSDGNIRGAVRLSAPGEGVVVPAGVWCELTDFTLDCVCVVAASQPYNAEGYVNSYSKYLELKIQR